MKKWNIKRTFLLSRKFLQISFLKYFFFSLNLKIYYLISLLFIVLLMIFFQIFTNKLNFKKKYLNQYFSSFSQLFQFKKHFTTQMGLYSSLSYDLAIGQRSPEKLFIYPQSGEVWHSHFFPRMFFKYLF